MTQQYQLPCQCGKQTLVSTTQAGETVRCRCGNLLPVPTLRGLRQLQPAESQPSLSGAAAGQPYWSLGSGLMFVGGTSLLLGSLATLFWLVIALSGLRTERYDVVASPEFQKFLDDMNQEPADKLWDEWIKLSDLEKFPLVQSREPFWIDQQARQSQTYLGIAITTVIALGGIALVCMAIAQRGKSMAK